MAKNNTSSANATSGGPDKRYEELGQPAAAKPVPYSLYPGKVAEVDLETRNINVQILGDFLVYNCKMMCDTMAMVLGFTSTAMPAVGTEVLLLYTPGGNSYVVGGTVADMVAPPKAGRYAVAGDYSDEMEMVNKEEYGTHRHETEDEFIGRGGNSPFDLLPGEKEWTTNTGTLIRMLYNFVQLSAGDLAKVEVGLMNDMVRIVDNYFVHHHVGGDDIIWSSGKCTSESHFTSWGFEAEGKTSKDEQLAQEGRGKYFYDPKKSTEDDWKDVDQTGRWRKSTYIGYLGDMIHAWISDPTKVISTWNNSLDALRTGRCRSWIGTDGTVMVQTVGAIHLEVAPRVIIPVVKSKWDNPQQNIVERMKALDANFLKIWQGGDWNDCRTAAWQMRSYARYLTQWHSLARWRMMESTGLVRVPNENEAEPPKAGCEEDERRNVVEDSPANYFGSVTIDQGGSITMVANGHTSVVLNNGDIQLAGPGNLEVKMGGMISMTGKSISLKAYENIEIIAVFGKLWLKARAALNALCERGRLWLKSDMKKSYAANKEDCAAGYNGGDKPVKPEDEKCSFGVVVESVDRPLLVKGDRGVMLATTKEEAPIYLNAKKPTKDTRRASIWLSTTGNIALQAGRHIYQMAKQCMGVSAQAGIGIKTGVLKLADYMLLKPGKIAYTGSMSLSGSVVANAGFKSPTYPHVVEGEDEPDVTVPKLDNEIIPAAVHLDSTESAWQGEADPKEAKPLWRIEESSDYKWKLWDWKASEGDVLDADALKKEYMQDTKEHGDPERVFQVLKHAEPVQVMNFNLLGAEETDTGNYPFPGKSGRMFEYSSGYSESLGKIGSSKFEEGHIGTKYDMTPTQWKTLIRKDLKYDNGEFRQ